MANMIKSILDKLSSRYQDKDPVVRMKAKFFILLCLAILLFLPIIISYTVHAQLNSPVLNYSINYRLIGFEIACWFALLFIFALLIKGRFTLSAHSLLILTFAGTWVAMLIDTSIPLVRLDTIVIVLALLSLVPVAILQKKAAIIFYGTANIIIFILFAYHAAQYHSLPYHAYVDYVADTTISMIFIILTGYTSFIIASKAIARIKKELTIRKETEKELQESWQRLSDIIDFLPDPTFAVDTSRKVIIWNRGMEDLTGIPANTTIGHTNYDFIFYGRERPFLVDYLLTKDQKIKELYPNLIETANTAACEIFVPEIGEGGSYLWASAKLLFDSRGKVAGAIESFRDTTERHRQESEKARLEEELLHSRKMESVGRLAGGIAHDFNNLLTTVIGNANLLLMNTDTGTPAHERLSDIIKAAESATALTRRLLAFSRKNPIAPRPINLNEEVNRTAALFTRIIGEQIQPQIHLHPEAGTISADTGQIEQIIINLVLNARDAMPNGGKLIIETRPVIIDAPLRGAKPAIKPGKYAALSISDTGSGMDENVMDHIFEPFFTTKPVGQGTGLGLSIVYGAITQIGGSILVESAVGKGTTITIFFPLSDKPAETTEAPKPIQQKSSGGKSVLVIEDDDSVRTMIIEGLIQHGYRAKGVAGKKDAMTVTEKETFDLVIADLILADATGADIAEELRRRNATTSFLFISGHADAAEKFPEISAGPHFLAKPFTINDLIKKIYILTEL